MLTLGIKIFCGLSSFIYFFLKLLPTRKKITFLSRQDNEASIDFLLLRAELQQQLPDYEFVTKCRMVGNSASAMLGYWPHMLIQMYHIATSKLVVLDTHCIPVSILKHKPGLRVLQLWHAMGLMKKAGHAAIGSSEGRSERLAELLHMHRGYTHILASSPACVQSMLEVFGYSGSGDARAGNSGSGDAQAGSMRVGKNAPPPEVIIGALPRLDLLCDKALTEETRRRFFSTYPQLAGKSVILYAPTVRKDDADMHEKARELAVAVAAANEQDGDYALVVKLHPVRDGLPAEVPASVGQSDHPQDGGACAIYDDIFPTVEVGRVADVCVSDYSSVVYEFLAMGKPTYFFAFDLDDYLLSRGLFIDYEKEVPGAVYKDAKSLVEAIANNTCSPQSQQAFLSKYLSLCKENTKELAKNIAEQVF